MTSNQNNTCQHLCVSRNVSTLNLMSTQKTAGNCFKIRQCEIHYVWYHFQGTYLSRNSVADRWRWMSHSFNKHTDCINTSHTSRIVIFSTIKTFSCPRANSSHVETVKHSMNKNYGIWILMNITNWIHSGLMLGNFLRKSADQKKRINNKSF